MISESNSFLITKDWNQLRHGMIHAWSNISDFHGSNYNLRIDFLQTISRCNFPHKYLIEDYIYMSPSTQTLLRQRVDSLFLWSELDALKEAVNELFGSKLKYREASLPLKINDNTLSDYSITGNYNHLKSHVVTKGIVMPFAFAAVLNIGHR